MKELNSTLKPATVLELIAGKNIIYIENTLTKQK